MGRLLFGVGFNDVDYKVTRSEMLDGKSVKVWKCPYYLKWCGILRRCFDNKFQKISSTYTECTIDPDWLYLSNFIKWVDSQPNRDWINCEPDKDLLVYGNKHYGKEFVIFIPKNVNSFIALSDKSRGDYMIGVSDSLRKKNPYQTKCSNPFTKKQRVIGNFKTELEAHKAWQAKKHEYACQLADLQDDPRVAKALRERYAPDKDWTNK